MADELNTNTQEAETAGEHVAPEPEAAQVPMNIPTIESEEPAAEAEAQLRALEDAERAISGAHRSGRVDRAKITQAAQLDVAEAVAVAGIAMEADEAADEAMRIAAIAESTGDRAKAREARKKFRKARKEARKSHKEATKSAKNAYNAIKFSDRNKMGFLRFVQIMFALHIFFVLVFLMLTSRDAMEYNVTSVMDWIMVVFEGIAFWAFINRYKVARPIVIVMCLVGIVVPGVFDYMNGSFSLFTTLVNGEFFLLLMLYFIFSKRVKATLVNDLGKDEGEYDKEEFVINRKGWPFVRNLIIYFIIFSVLGHWMEMGMCQLIIAGLVEGEYDPSNTMLWRDWLYPFPMEGAAVVLIALFLYPLFINMKKKFKNKLAPYLLSFLANALMCSLIEFSMGLIFNANYQLWDYRENFGNIMGQVCLQNALAFGVAASIITWFVYPMLERTLARVPRDIMNIVFVAVAIFGGIIWSLYIVEPPQITDDGGAIISDSDITELQRLAIAVELADLAKNMDEFQDTLDTLDKLDTSVAKEDMDEINARIRALAEKFEVLELFEEEVAQQSGGTGTPPADGGSAAPPADAGSAQGSGSGAASGAEVVPLDAGSGSGELADAA